MRSCRTSSEHPRRPASRAPHPHPGGWRVDAIASAPPPVSLPFVADFSRLTPDERFFPLDRFVETLTEAWSRRPDLWQYAPPLGLEELRVEISRRLSESGIARSPDEIRTCADAILTRYDEVKVRGYVQVLAHRQTRECLQRETCDPAPAR